MMLQPPASAKNLLALTDPVELLAHLSGDGQAGRHVHATLGHLAKVGTLATELQAARKSARVRHGVLALRYPSPRRQQALQGH
jgi:hypothetical protein